MSEETKPSFLSNGIRQQKQQNQSQNLKFLREFCKAQVNEL